MNWRALLDAVSGGGPCDARSVEGTVTAAMVTELREAAPTEGGRPVLNRANFHKVVFEGPVDFTNVRFDGWASFAGAVFRGNCRFSLARFELDAVFRKALFQCEAIFEYVQVKRQCRFDQAAFGELCSFFGLQAGLLDLSGVTFQGRANLQDVRVESFLNLLETQFAEPVHKFNVGAAHLLMQGARIARGGRLYVQGGTIVLDAARLEAPTIIAGQRFSGQFMNIDESLVVTGKTWRPNVTSLRGVDLSPLILADVDLSDCRFDETHHLDRLGMEKMTIFDGPPRGIQRALILPPMWRWSPRITIAEERQWRSGTRRWKGWAENPAPTSTPERADQLARTYRALRKGREDAKNEPGAADFYYGEMEMRRHGTAGRGERLVLWLYWLISGYGLRPLRTVVALAAVSSLAAAILMLGGSMTEMAYWSAWQASFGATVNVDILPREAFTELGHWVRIVLRILGPLLYGLTVLAIRGRVKR